MLGLVPLMVKTRPLRQLPTFRDPGELRASPQCVRAPAFHDDCLPFHISQTVFSSCVPGDADRFSCLGVGRVQWPDEFEKYHVFSLTLPNPPSMHLRP